MSDAGSGMDESVRSRMIEPFEDLSELRDMNRSNITGDRVQLCYRDSASEN